MAAIPTFEQLPKIVADLNEKVDALIAQIKQSHSEPVDRLMTIDELIVYLPEHPAKPTIFGWTCNRAIPFSKYGRRLYFKKSEIDQWLDRGRQMTTR